MKFIRPAVFFAAAAFVVSGCSSAKTASESPKPDKAKQAETAAVSESREPSTPPAASDTNKPKTFSERLAEKKARVEALRGDTENSPGTPATEVKAISKPAPDNSEYSVTMTDVAVETRTFKNHPQLLKVVKTIDPKNQRIKVFLTGGKVVELPGAKIPSLATESAASILRAVGAEPSGEPQAAKRESMSRSRSSRKAQ